MGEEATGTKHTVREVGSSTAGPSSSQAGSVQQGATSEPEEDSPPLIPRLVRDDVSRKRWIWVPYPVRRFLTATEQWARGPPNPQAHKIEPLFPVVQHAPAQLLDRYLPETRFRRWRVALFYLWLGLWLMTFALVMRRGLNSGEIEGFGEPGDIGCGTTYWVAGNECGLDGNDCRPFNGSEFAFRCPANCASYQVLNHRAVGDQEIIYQTLVIGGPANDSDRSPVYRGDSFICSAGIHAGAVTDSAGGCGVARLVGKRPRFVASLRNGIQSVGFDSYFPLAFTFEPGVGCRAVDMRWYLLIVSVVFSVVIALFVTAPGAFFFSIFSGVFFHVGLASDPPSHRSTPDLISTVIGRYLPVMLAAWVIYDKMGVRRTLGGLTAQIEKTVLWLGGCWVGALENYTFSWIPIQRLTPHDLEQQPGAKVALAFIVLILLVVAATQIWFFRQEGRLLKYLRLYLLFGAGLVICALLPDLSLRIHHYILALLLLPGVSMQTRPALLYQGLLVGLFINGIARWDWSPILQTAFSLRGDANLGSPLPELQVPVIALAGAGANVSTITFTWRPPPGPRYDGISALVNDVERFRGYFADFAGEGAQKEEFVWERGAGVQLDEYFRFAYMEGSSADDYTRAGTWTHGGAWVDMEPGPSRVKGRSLDGEGTVTAMRRRRVG